MFLRRIYAAVFRRPKLTLEKKGTLVKIGRNIIPLNLLATALLAGIRAGIAQSIQFDPLPPPGASGTASGHCRDVDVSKYGVALFINVFGTWWTKPTFTRPITSLENDGSFINLITTGGQDACSQTVAAYVVPLDTGADSIRANGEARLPSALDQIAIAHVVTSRSAAATILFAGRVWLIKMTEDCVWGPGPNYFSNDNVSVDSQGRLHLKVAYVNGAWRCAEVILTESLGYGTYTFRFDSDLSGLPDPIVIGAFTYSDNPEHTHREIDLEFSNGGVVGAPQNLQYAIQPYGDINHRHRFSAPANTVSSTHVITWSPGLASFKSFIGLPTIGPRQIVLDYGIQRSVIGGLEFAPQPGFGDSIGSVRFSSPTNITVLDLANYANRNVFYRAHLEKLAETGDPQPFEAWSTQSEVPPANTERVHLNTWLFAGTAPGPADQTYEVIIKDFEFKPETIDLEILRPRLELQKVEPFKKELLLIHSGK